MGGLEGAVELGDLWFLVFMLTSTLIHSKCSINVSCCSYIFQDERILSMFQWQLVDSTGEGETDCRQGRGRIFRVTFLYR